VNNKIAIAGKGGSGKTTIAGILARTLARDGRPVWAIDADTSPNLALPLGVPRERLGELKAMPRSILKEQTDDAGKRKMLLAVPPAEVASSFGVPTPDGPTLLLMGTVDHAGAG
jgi:CO dehydrogenase maturation factor